MNKVKIPQTVVGPMLLVLRRFNRPVVAPALPTTIANFGRLYKKGSALMVRRITKILYQHSYSTLESTAGRYRLALRR